MDAGIDAMVTDSQTIYNSGWQRPRAGRLRESGELVS